MSKTSSELGGAFPFDFEPKKEPLPVNEELLCELPNGTLLRWQFGKRKAPIRQFPHEKDDKSLQNAIKRAVKRLDAARSKEEIREAKSSFPKTFTIQIQSHYQV